MLVQPILDKLGYLKLAGMGEGLREQMENPAYRKLSFEERLGLLLDKEWTLRQNRKQTRRMRVARFRETAHLEDFDFSAARGLDRSQVLVLAQEDWIHRHLNVIITGPTGAGKTYLACALGSVRLPQRRFRPLFSDRETPPENHFCPGRGLLAEVPGKLGQDPTPDHRRLVTESPDRISNTGSSRNPRRSL